MRALAEFIMKGRVQAVAVAGLAMGTLMFAWVGAAAAALVLLRKGLAEGAYVVFWALLPAIAVAYIGGDVAPLAMLLGAAVTAQVLRDSRSWPLAMVAAAGAGLATAFGLKHFGQPYLQSLIALLQPVMDQLQAQSQQTMPVVGPSAIAAGIGFSAALWSILAVLLARWWQAVLYNPGGFREEMWALRLPPIISLGLVAMMLVLRDSADPIRVLGFSVWSGICALPLVISGIALVHGAVGLRQMGRVWLVGFYIAMLLLGPLGLMTVMLLAILDSWIDFRKRLLPPAGQ